MSRQSLSRPSALLIAIWDTSVINAINFSHGGRVKHLPGCMRRIHSSIALSSNNQIILPLGCQWVLSRMREFTPHYLRISNPKPTSFSFREPILLHPAVQVSCQFMYIMMAPSRLMAPKVDDAFFVSTESHRYDPDHR